MHVEDYGYNELILVCDSAYSGASTVVANPQPYSHAALHYCLMIDGKCWLWVSPCSGRCSQVPMPTAQPDWCPNGARYSTTAEFNGAQSEINNRRSEFHGRCSAGVFDPKW